MANDFERRMLDVIKSSEFIASIARKDKNIVAIEYYAYNTSLTGILTLTQATLGIQVQADSDFAITYCAGAVVSAGAIVGAPLLTVQYTDTGSGKTFYSAPTLFGIVHGTGGLPYFLPAPRVLAPNTNINIAANNLSAVTYDVYISLMGARVYYQN